MGFLTKKDPIADLTRVADKNPKDTRSALELAGLLAKKGDTAGAIDRYLRAAKVFQAEGFHQKGAAAAKQALALSPKNIEAHEFLADLYEAVKKARARLDALGPGR